MEEKKSDQPKKKYVYVKDEDGIEYVCRLDDLKRVDKLSEDEKDKCMSPPGDA